MGFVVALQISGLVLLLVGLGVWFVRPMTRPAALWVMIAGAIVLLLSFWVRMQSPAASSAQMPAANANNARPVVRITAVPAGNLTQGPDGNYFLSVRLTLENAGPVPADAIANIQLMPDASLTQNGQRRILLIFKKAGVRMGNAIFAGQPDPGTIEEISIPASTVKITEIKEHGMYRVILPAMLIVATYQPLIKGNIFQTSHVIRAGGEAPLPIPNNNVLLDGADMRFDRLPGFDTDG